MRIRALVVVDEKKQSRWQPGAEEVTMRPVHAGAKVPEAQQFAEATPTGILTLQMKKSVADLYKMGQHYWVDFTPVEE